MSNIERSVGSPARVGRPAAGATRSVSQIRYIEEGEGLSWSDARLDRRQESRHTVQMRELRREADQGAGEAARDVAIAVAELKALRQYNYEAKQELARAHRESELLAGGNVALQANFAQMDEVLYRQGLMLGLDLA